MKVVTTIHVEAEEWMIAAGLIGLSRLYPEARRQVTKTGYLLPAELLDDLAARYVQHMTEHHSIVNRDVKRMSWYTSQAHNKPEKIKDYAGDIRKIMNDQLKKVEKYFPNSDEYKHLVDLVETMKDIADGSEQQRLEEAVESYRKWMSVAYIHDKLTMNYVKSIILEPFFGQASILQKTFSSKTIQEHIDQIQIDFVTPARLELEFHQVLQSEDLTATVTFLEQNNTYKPFADWYRAVKKLKTVDELKKFFHSEVLTCSLIDGIFATQSFEEKSFVPLAFSKEKAVNFGWNLDKKHPVPISAVARLILFLAPVGFTTYTRKIGNGQSSETHRFFGLLMTKKNFAHDLKLNHTYWHKRAGNVEFADAILSVLDETSDKAKKLQEPIFMIEVSSEYQAKKTLMDYYHMPAHLVSFLSSKSYLLKGMKNYPLRDQFLRDVLKGLDPKKLVYEYIRIAITESYHSYGAYQAAFARVQIMNSKLGVDEMDKSDKTVSYIYYQGLNLRKHYIGNTSSNKDDGPYRASGSKKVEGIAYRLLNAAKAGNKVEFMDTLFRIYLSANTSKSKEKQLSVPSIFVDAFKMQGLDFDTIATVFIAGLLGQEMVNKEEVVTHE